MLRLRQSIKHKDLGFTVVEILVVIVLIGILSTAAYTFFNTSLINYLNLQQDSMSLGDLATQSQRIARVLRGLTDITSASSDDITVYAYFTPSDTYVSLIHYYKNAAKTQLFADVTQMTANPPIGTPIVSTLRTYTVIDNFYNAGGGLNTFVYLDSASVPLPMPIVDLHTIKGIQINLAVPSKEPSANGYISTTVQVSLRNRKTNL